MCPDHSSGEYCQECDPGYARDPSSGSCVAIDTQGCDCDKTGSIRDEYLNGNYIE